MFRRITPETNHHAQFRHPLFHRRASASHLRDLILPVLLHPHHHKLNAGELQSESLRDLIRREQNQRTLPNKTAVDCEGSDDADLKAGRSP
ncbi:unnamed protein product [Brassica oleracea]|uniref:Uncharacterized protein n=2 Tax=Brassica TaxID=3705 RepID=A0A3P6AII5_BRAOL|nr:unnamed protein product [Brassica napus]VDC85020.1 unnamed protein product [Brassica oleracea]